MTPCRPRTKLDGLTGRLRRRVRVLSSVHTTNSADLANRAEETEARPFVSL